MYLSIYSIYLSQRIVQITRIKQDRRKQSEKVEKEKGGPQWSSIKFLLPSFTNFSCNYILERAW